MKAIRKSFAESLIRLAADHEFYVMDGDLSKATFTNLFKEAYPDRFIDMGIAEANLYGTAAGISTCGMPVVACTFAAFAAGRAYDQIRNSIAYPGNNVKICATHGGIQAGADGGSHQCLEDLAVMRAIPRMKVLCPCDERETFAAMKTALESPGPVYVRIGRSIVPDVFETDVSVEFGKGNVVRDGKDITIIATGEMVHKAVAAAGLLKEEGIDAAVISMVSIKPIDEKLIVQYAQKTGRIVTAEDHNVMGGLSGAVSEVLVQKCPVSAVFCGVKDVFGCSGNEEQLDEKFGLRPQDIVEAAHKLF